MAMIKCPECGKEISDLAEKCPNCGFPIGFESVHTQNTNNYNSSNNNAYQNRNPYQNQQNPQQLRTYVPESKNSGLGIAALILSILGCTFWLGIILAIIDLCRKDGKKKILSIISLCICAFWIILALSVGGDSDEKKSVLSTESQSVSIENAVSNDLKDENKEITETEEIKEEIEEKETYEEYIEITSTELIDAYNENQVKCKQMYDGKTIKVTGTVSSVGTDIMGDTYVCLGHDTEFTFVGIQCYAKDNETINQIAELKEGDIITVYGKGQCGSLSFSVKDSKIE